MTDTEKPRVRRGKSSLLPSDPVIDIPKPSEPEKASPVGKIVATVAVLGLFGGAYVATQGGSDVGSAQVGVSQPSDPMVAETQATPDPVIEPESTVEIAASPTETLPEEPVEQAALATPEAPALPQIEDVAVIEEVVEDAPVQSPLALVQPTAGATECERVIYTDLATLQEAAYSGATWSTHQRMVTTVVQGIINCDGTSFDVVGSFDSLSDGQGDLSIAWDSQRRHLTLEVVELGAELASASIAGASDALFILR